MPLTNRPSNDSGTTLPFVMFALIALFAFAALSVDLGFLFNVRRSAQVAADAAALGAALDFYGEEATLRDEALKVARSNLINDYSDAEWNALWQTCVDPDRPVSFIDVGGLECVSIDRFAGMLRVRVPDQRFSTFFAHLIGVDTLESGAVSMVQVKPMPVLPFGMAPAAPTGENCLKNPPGGHALLPCTGPTSGNFGSIISVRYQRACVGSKSEALVENMLLGIDHALGIKTPASATIPDACYNYRPNQVYTDSGGFDKEAAEGLITGSGLFPGVPGLLTTGTNPKRQVTIDGQMYQVDNRPLWDYLIPNGTPGCDPTVIGALSEAAAASAMTTCLTAWTSGELFDSSILDSPRLGVVMQFNETTPPTGSDPRTIQRFRAVFVHRIAFPTVVMSPGTPGPVAGESKVEQVTAFTLPNTPLIAGRTDSSGGALRPGTIGLR